MSDARAVLRHQLATLAYRTQRTLQGAPAGFEEFQAGAGVRTPRDLLHHMSQLLNFTVGLWTETSATPLEADVSLQAEVDRFHAQLARLSDVLRTSPMPAPVLLLRVVQGPLADAMTHVGQLAMLRRLAGAPVPRESYYTASIDADNVGPHQPPPAAG